MTPEERERKAKEEKLAEIRAKLKQAEEEELQKWENERAENKKKNTEKLIEFANTKGLLIENIEILIGFLNVYETATEKQKEVWKLKGQEIFLEKDLQHITPIVSPEKDIDLITEEEVDETEETEKILEKNQSKAIFSEIPFDEKYCPECRKDDEEEIKLMIRKDFNNPNKQTGFCSRCKRYFTIAKKTRN